MSKRASDGLPHWHYDCRIESELPENRVVGIRFLTTAAFALLAAVTFLSSAWLLYRTVTLRYQITDWYQRIEDERRGMEDVDRMQAEYGTESARIDAAYSVMKHQYVVSEFLANLGKLLPDGMELSDIESNDSGVVIMGTIHQSTEVASKTLSGFVRTLNADPSMEKLFASVRLTSLSRRDTDDVIVYRVTFLSKS